MPLFSREELDRAQGFEDEGTEVGPPPPGAPTIEAPTPSTPQPEPPSLLRALERFGIEPKPPPVPPASVVPRFEMSPEMKELRQWGDDLQSRARFNLGLDPTLEGNFPVKAEALQAREESEGLPPTGLELVPPSVSKVINTGVEIGANAVSEVGDLFVGTGLGLGLLAQQAFRAARAIAGVEPLYGVEVFIPNPLTEQEERIVFPWPSVQEMPEEERQKLVALGARFGPEPFEKGVWDQILDEEALRLGLVNPDQVPPDATTYNVPLFERNFSLSTFGEKSIERPLSRALDVLILAGAPGATARAGGASILGAGRAARLATFGATQGTRFESVLGRAAAVAFETGEYLRPSNSLRRMTQSTLSLTPSGARYVDSWNARVLTKQLVNEADEMGFAQTRMAEAEIGRALRGLNDAERKALGVDGVAVLEGRASLLPGFNSPAFENALGVINKQIRARELELLEVGKLRPQTTVDRAFAPLAVTRTGKRIPYKEWDEVDVARANARVRKQNAAWLDDGLDENVMPEFMRPGEYEQALRAVKDDWLTMVRDVNRLPDVEQIAPIYFPRFPEPKGAMEMLVASIRGKGGALRPGKQPIERQFTGMSLLRNADIKDVKLQLGRHNAMTRRVVDSARLIDDVKNAPFTRRVIVEGDEVVDAATGAAINIEREGLTLWNPEGMLKFYRQQLDLGKTSFEYLDEFGHVEEAFAFAVRDSLKGFGPTLTKSMKRQEMFAIPRSASNQLISSRNLRAAGTMGKMSLFYDKAIDAWRTAVLAFSPRWHFNNMVGGVVLGTFAGGIPPQRLLRPLSKAEQAALPIHLREGAQTLVFAERFHPRLGGAATTARGRVGEAIRNTQPIKTTADNVGRLRDASFSFNAKVDNHFRSRVYLELGRKQARNEVLKRTGNVFYSSREMLEEVGKISNDPTLRRELMRRVDRFFVNFNNLSPFERQYMRRVVPFWSWYREIHRVAANMPFNAPARTAILKNLASASTEIDDREWRKHMGFERKHYPEYVRDNVFMGIDEDGKARLMSTRGFNVFYGIGRPQESLGSLTPVLQQVITEATGGRPFGRWGSYVPFKRFNTAEIVEGPEGKTIKLKGTTGKEFALRFARNTPQFVFAEDIAQAITEGEITQRFEDVSPLTNVARNVAGRQAVPTAVLRERKGVLAPKRTRTSGEVIRRQFGVGIAHLYAHEIMEQHLKSNRSALNEATRNYQAAVPEYRRLLEEAMGEQPPGSTGIHDFDLDELRRRAIESKTEEAP